MKIKIISDDRYSRTEGDHVFGPTHLSRVAWDLSRSPDDPTPLNKILSIDAPVNEIPSMVLNIECTILEREIFAAFRDHVMWARTSRVDEPAEFQMDSYFKKSNYSFLLEDLREKIKEEKSVGVIQDEYRMLMPLCAQTSFTTRLSWRGLIKLFKFFEFLTTHNSYFVYTVQEMERVLKLSKFADGYSFVNPIPELKEHEKVNGKHGPIITVSKNIPIALRAQIIRHRNFIVADDLFKLIKFPDCWTRTIGTKMAMSISTSVDIWKSIVNKRQCWIAQYGIWKEIILEAQKYLTISEQDLPCSGGSCPYTRDAELRHTDKDPGAPCPIHSNLTNTPVNEKYKNSVYTEASYRPNFWKKHIKEVEWTK